jgi:hypothetical protein
VYFLPVLLLMLVLPVLSTGMEHFFFHSPEAAVLCPSFGNWELPISRSEPSAFFRC